MSSAKQFLRGRYLPRVVLFVVLFAWPSIYTNDYLVTTLLIAGVYAVMAIGVNLVNGQSGQGSMGHAAFAGIGAYTSALLTSNFAVPPIVALVCSVLVAALVGYFVGRPVLKFTHAFLTMATLALVFIFQVLALELMNITGGETGVVGVPYFSLGPLVFDSYQDNYYLVWGVVLAVLLFVEAFMRSRSGRALRALSVNERAASSLGIDVSAWKLRAFVFSSGLCGLGGGLFVFFMGTVTPNDFGLSLVILVLLMVVLGGQSSVFASIIGALVITYAQYRLGSLQQYSSGVFGMVLLAVLLLLPKGLVGIVDLMRPERARQLGRAISRVLGRFPWDVAAAIPATASSSSVSGSQSCQIAHDGVPAGEECSFSEGTAGVSATDVESAQSEARRAGGGRGFLRTGIPEDPGGAAAEESALVIEDVTVAFGGLLALSHVTLEPRQGEITALIGPNGAGKTTLFNVISGLQKPTSGHIWFKGKDVTRLRSDQVARLGMSRTFQNLRIFQNMTVIDNVMVGRHRHERSHFFAGGFTLPSQRREERESREVAMRVLEFVGLDHRAEDEAKSLPYGQQRLVEIARALASEPTLFLLDEPAAGMNQTEREALVQLIREISATGIEVILVEHNMNLVMSISGQIAVLDHGHKICEGDAETVQCDPQVIEAYLGAGHTTAVEAEEIAVQISDVPPETVKVDEPVRVGDRILRVHGISTYYGAIGAVRDVSLDVKPGEILAVLGANGAGKTTLLRTISGILRPRSGRVFFEERDITRLSAPEIVELGICQTPEGRHVFPTLSVLDNLSLGAGRLHHKGTEYQEALDAVFELFPRLHERRKQSAGSLSGGEQQMLAIGRGMMGQPRILLLDEPSMGLAPVLTASIFESLQVLNERGMTLLMVEQNAEAALEIADRVIVLVTGTVELAGNAADLRRDPRVRALYMGGETN